MSYHVTMLRTRHGKRVQIAMTDVERAIASFPDLRIGTDTRGRLVVWLNARGRDGVLLVWQNGELWTQNPCREDLQILLHLAEKLHARVRGDAWETYRTPEETYKHPDDLLAIQSAQQSASRLIRRTRYHQWMLNVMMVVVLVLLGLLVNALSR